MVDPSFSHASVFLDYFADFVGIGSKHDALLFSLEYNK